MRPFPTETRADSHGGDAVLLHPTPLALTKWLESPWQQGPEPLS